MESPWLLLIISLQKVMINTWNLKKKDKWRKSKMILNQKNKKWSQFMKIWVSSQKFQRRLLIFCQQIKKDFWVLWWLRNYSWFLTSRTLSRTVWLHFSVSVFSDWCLWFPFWLHLQMTCNWMISIFGQLFQFHYFSCLCWDSEKVS